jgi:hypothetical protein
MFAFTIYDIPVFLLAVEEHVCKHVSSLKGAWWCLFNIHNFIIDILTTHVDILDCSE